MNVWSCDKAGCKATAMGEGGGIGLRAIGWYFKVGPVFFCPNHRPDASEKDFSAEWHDPGYGGGDGPAVTACAPCTARKEAKHLQAVIEAVLGPSGRIPTEERP